MRTHNEAIERRRHERGITAAQPTREDVISTIIGNFREMPGLCLHLNPATLRMAGAHLRGDSSKTLSRRARFAARLMGSTWGPGST
jgi:hypothetical protein